MSIRLRLLRLDDEFLSAIIQGEAAVEAFDVAFTSLLHDVQDAIEKSSIDDETLMLANDSASRIACLAETFQDFHVDANLLTSDMTTELEEIMERLTLQDVSTTQERESYPCSTPGPSTKRMPSIGSVAYNWLVDNLHNPYPSTKAKRTLALRCGSTTSIIAQWFKDIRTRIGWTALRINTFGGSRGNILDAARCAYSTVESEQTLSSNVLSQFHIIKANVLQLMKEQQTEDSGLWDPPESMQVAPTCEATHGRRARPTKRKRSVSSSKPAMPSQSRASPTPSLTSGSSSDESDDDLAIAALLSHTQYPKPHIPTFCHTEKGTGQQEYYSTYAPAGFFTPLLSTPSLSHNVEIFLQQDIPLQQLPFHSSSNSPMSCQEHASPYTADETGDKTPSDSSPRKRRRSDADAASTRLPKRVRVLDSEVGQQQMPSDSFSGVVSRELEHTISPDWTASIFDVPEQISNPEIDSMGTVDVDVYVDWSSLLATADSPLHSTFIAPTIPAVQEYVETSPQNSTHNLPQSLPPMIQPDAFHSVYVTGYPLGTIDTQDVITFDNINVTPMTCLSSCEERSPESDRRMLARTNADAPWTWTTQPSISVVSLSCRPSTACGQQIEQHCNDSATHLFDLNEETADTEVLRNPNNQRNATPVSDRDQFLDLLESLSTGGPPGPSSPYLPTHGTQLPLTDHHSNSQSNMHDPCRVGILGLVGDTLQQCLPASIAACKSSLPAGPMQIFV